MDPDAHPSAHKLTQGDFEVLFLLSHGVYSGHSTVTWGKQLPNNITLGLLHLELLGMHSEIRGTEER